MGKGKRGKSQNDAVPGARTLQRTDRARNIANSGSDIGTRAKTRKAALEGFPSLSPAALVQSCLVKRTPRDGESRNTLHDDNCVYSIHSRSRAAKYNLRHVSECVAHLEPCPLAFGEWGYLNPVRSAPGFDSLAPRELHAAVVSQPR